MPKRRSEKENSSEARSDFCFACARFVGLSAGVNNSTCRPVNIDEWNRQRFIVRRGCCEAHRRDYVQKLIPGASAPEKERYPLRCTVRNDRSALEITFDTGPDEPVKGADFVAGLAKAAYLERLDPVSRGDAYLIVILGKDDTDINRNLHVEVAGHDGKDHKDDAIAVAKDILAHLR